MENKVGNFESPSITSFETENTDIDSVIEVQETQYERIETQVDEKPAINENDEKHEDISKSNDSENETLNNLESVEEPEEEIPTKDDGWEDVLGSGALLKKILKPGIENTRPQRLDMCTLNYTCSLEDGTNVESEDNVVIQMGDLEVIQGIDVALSLMNVGEKSLLRIEPRLAYGSKGLDTNVPPETTVIYEIELVKVEPEPEMDTLTIAQRKNLGEIKKKRGNWWYGRGECTFAIQCYRRALDYLDEVEGGVSDPIPENDDAEQRAKTDAALQDLMTDRINVSNNMAAAQMKLGAYDAALQSLQIVLRCQPNNVKALYRKAKVLKAMNEVPDSLKCLLKAQSLEPDNTTIQKEMNDINMILKKHKTYEKELAKRMLNSSTSKNEPKEKDSKNKNKSFMWTSIALSIAIGVAGVAAWRFKFS